eukprot:1075017-Prorocentrum_minimum.AAC.2
MQASKQSTGVRSLRLVIAWSHGSTVLTEPKSALRPTTKYRAQSDYLVKLYRVSVVDTQPHIPSSRFFGLGIWWSVFPRRTKGKERGQQQRETSPAKHALPQEGASPAGQPEGSTQGPVVWRAPSVPDYTPASELCSACRGWS